MEIRIRECEHSTRRDWISSVLRAAGTGVLVRAAHAADPSWEPLFLSAAQNEHLVALGECIIPGSKDALCNRIIDLVLSIDSDKNKTDFVNALAAFDAPAGPSHELLARASSSGDPLWPDFQLLKEWLADTYWSSKQGLQELGWTGRVSWSKFDGCPHAGIT
jgi:hypothetical protein